MGGRGVKSHRAVLVKKNVNIRHICTFHSLDQICYLHLAHFIIFLHFFLLPEYSEHTNFRFYAKYPILRPYGIPYPQKAPPVPISASGAATHPCPYPGSCVSTNPTCPTS
ncbi:hypothetical protein M089_4431 [Bacteroides ovatus str. 3725 D9 iii]|nr:hypothetical protein M089_4431 [Bacteroides ovatus str. 3725 D9 iii]